MNRSIQKLRSTRGSSMVMALLLMVVAVMVSGTILSAAVTAARNLPMGSSGQQAYLTVSSAAEAFRDAVMCYDGQYQRKHTRAVKVENGQVDADETVDTMPDLKDERNVFAKELEEALKFVMTNNGIDYENSFTISADGYDKVYMTLAIKSRYSVSGQYYTMTAIFSNVGADAKLPANPCRMQVNAQATMETSRFDISGAVTGASDWASETITWRFSDAQITRIKEAISETNAEPEG